MEMVVIIRPSFMKFCKDGCRAALFNHALYWIAQKAKGQPKEKVRAGQVTWYGTTEELAEGLAGSWGVCKVRSEINALIKLGIIGLGKNPRWGAGRTKHFYFGTEQCAKLLELCQQHQICLLHLGLNNTVLDLIKRTNDNPIICTCLQTIDSSDTNDTSIDTQKSNSSNTNDNFIGSSDKSIESYTKVTAKASSKDINTKDTAKKEETPPASPSVSLFSQDEEEFLSWLKEKDIPRRKDVEAVKQQIAFIRDRITTREQLHRYCDYAIEAFRKRENPTVSLGNLASEKLMRDFLQAEKVLQSSIEPEPFIAASQDDIESLAAEILREYPEIVLVVKSDEYGPCIEMPNGEPFADGVRDAEDWRILRSNTHRLAQVLAYGRQRVMVA